MPNWTLLAGNGEIVRTVMSVELYLVRRTTEKYSKDYSADIEQLCNVEGQQQPLNIECQQKSTKQQ